MKRSNCYIFAKWLYWTRGGYIAYRATRPPLPSFLRHWLWSSDLKHWLHYEPINRKEDNKSWIDKFWFKGRIRRYDTPWRKDNDVNTD